MPKLTVHLTEKEKLILARRSRKAGMKKATFMRRLILERPLGAAADVLTDLGRHLGDGRLRIRKRAPVDYWARLTSYQPVAITAAQARSLHKEARRDC